MSTLIIAEAGVNHNGDLDRACDLVDAAAEAGADLVKFQTFSAERVVASRAPKAEYQLKGTAAAESQLEMLRRLELSRDAHETLMARSLQRGIRFFSTAFDLSSIDLLASLGLDQFKVPSGEITNLPYLRAIGRLGGSVFLSTGMATLGEIDDALAVLETAGTARERVTILHCTTEYPAPFEEVNLRAMASLREAFGVPVGYSDHTSGIEIPIAAVALGASTIEKHFTLDRSLPGPDHAASLEPVELAAMVRSIRNLEIALGDGIKRPTASELRNRDIARKSIVAARPILAGETFGENNLTAKRPGTGLSPMLWDRVVGRIASRSFETDEAIEW